MPKDQKYIYVIRKLWLLDFMHNLKILSLTCVSRINLSLHLIITIYIYIYIYTSPTRQQLRPKIISVKCNSPILFLIGKKSLTSES